MIPVFEPFIGDEEAEAVADAVRRGEISGSFGVEIPSFEGEFAEYVGAKHGVAVTSGTTALHLAIAALQLEPGAEIVMSSSTNIATALAAYHNGHLAIPIDSEPVTWNIDLELVESRITPRTRAIIPVHLFGHPVDMDAVQEIALRHDLVVIEDCAESHGATVRGRMTGGLGDMGCFSFYANKIITTGEGGMVTTNDDSLAERLRLLRNLAFGKPRFLHHEAGFNFRMTGFQAAMGRTQLQKIDFIIEQKRRVAAAYGAALGDVLGIRTPVELDWARNVYWMYAIEVGEDFPLSRDELATLLGDSGIESRTFFCPLNMQPFLQRQPGFRAIACPVAERLWRTGLYLPSSITLSDTEIATIVAVIRSPVSRMNTYSGLHARNYDVLYADKPYAEEARFVDALLNSAGVASGALLDVACGTGRHAREFAALGWTVTGVDLSEELLEQARLNAPTVRFFQQDMRGLDVEGSPFDAVTCLFDSIGYALDDAGVLATLGAMRRHAGTESALVIEFLHAPALLAAASPTRVRRSELPHGDELVRISETDVDESRGLMEVEYELIALHADGTFERWCESHSNRFFSVSEMSDLLERAGLRPEGFVRAYDHSRPFDDETFHVMATATVA